ncbi:TonB-dependent receptor [Sphingomonas sp. ABOLD]|nr:TonB-dependent receptor [Sphingomonas sp. ABOLD]
MTMEATRRLVRSAAGMSILALTTALAAPAWAQEAVPETTAAEPLSPAQEQEIIVTGTNISGVKPVGSETVTVNRDQMLATGLTDVASVLQTLPQVQNNPNSGGSGPVYRQGGTAGYGGNSTQGTAINLRGLGTSATLTLVDGRRVVPSGAATTFTEAIQLPIAAIERVEVVSDGNSAIYGSDAISGVINYVLRKHFTGIEVTGRGTVTRYNNQWGGSITAGYDWGSGNVLATYDYDYREPFANGRSKFLRRDLRGVGGPDTRAVDATLGVTGPTLIVGGNGSPYSYYTLPRGAGPGIAFGQLTPGANLVDSADYTDFLGKQKRHQGALILNQDVNDAISVFAQGFYTKRDTLSRAYGNSRLGNNITICQGSPTYIGGAPANAASSSALCGGAPGQLIAVDPLLFFNGPSVTSNPAETISVTGGFTGKLPGSWKVDGYFTYAHDSTCGICNYDNNANGAALSAEIRAGRIDPFTTTPLTAAQYGTFMGSNVQLAYNTFYDSLLKLDGPLFALPAGSVRTAFGGELAYNRQHLVNGSNNAFENNPANNNYAVTNDTTARRTTASAFAELFVPILGADMGIPLVQSLDLDAAVRYDNYSDFGSTTNPKVGATWRVNDALSIRGSWGTSFRAPALTDTNPRNFSAAVIGVPIVNASGRPDIGFVFPGNSSAYQIIGANPDLQPETATTWSAGLDFAPKTSGFRASVTYYNTHYSNQIVGQNTGLFLSNPTFASLYSRYIIPVNNPATCVSGSPATYDPVLARFIAGHPALYNVPVLGACSVNVIVDGRSANAATTFQDGIDVQLSYTLQTGIGRWFVSANATRILNQTLQTVAGGMTQDVLDTYYYPVSLRGRGQIGWNKSGFGVNLFVNYVGSYTNTIPLPGQPQSEVPSWTTADLGISYAVPKGGKLLGGLRLGLNVQNVTNEDPPIVLTRAGSNFGAYDPSNANILGRTFNFQITKSF